jgi:glycosyltransferase involved in cell wall biosynthesis
LNVSEKKRLRICIVSEQLAGGGAERCSAVLSQFLANHNCEVHHIVVIDKISYEYSGNLLNLGKLKSDKYNLYDRVLRFKVLVQFFNSNTFDFIIDTRVVNRQFQEFFITKFIYNAPVIKIVHSFMTELYFPKNRFLAQHIFSKVKKIITVSNSIKTKIEKEYHYHQVATIYNPIDLKFIDNKAKLFANYDFEYILAVGNMNTNVKQFDHLIDCYSKSDLPKHNIKLVILGEGLLQNGFLDLVKKLKLEDKVLFKGLVENPFLFYKTALFTVLTSKNEGFPTVLLESLASETPVVAYNCQSGPSEIIKHLENGILVDNQNKIKMIEAMNEMFSNKNLYLHCKKNARQSVEKFSIEKIGNQWLQLFNSLS